MIKRNKIIMTLVIVLVCSGVTFALLQKEGRSTASDMGIPHSELPAKRLTTKSDIELASDLGTDSIDDHLANYPIQGKEQLLFYKDSLIALSQQVTDSTVHSNSAQDENAEQKYEIVALRE